MRRSRTQLAQALPGGHLELTRSGRFAVSGEIHQGERLGAAMLNYVSLLKLRPMSVVIFTAVAGLVAARGHVDLATAIVAIICIALGGYGSAVLNMWFEADIDTKMARTAGRALPAGRLKASDALLIGTAMSLGSVAVMAAVVNTTAAIMLAATIFCYAILYTVVFKQRTVLNVPVAGALAGILTPLTGWAAATGTVDKTALILFAYVFLWTPPHVWSQATYRVTDYRRAGTPMLPAVAGLPAARLWIMIFTAGHSAVAVLPWLTGDAGLVYASTALLAGTCLVWKAARLYRCASSANTVREAREYFRLSIAYIVILLVALCLDRIIFTP